MPHFLVLIDFLAQNVDLNDIKTVKRVGGTIDDTVLVDGLVLPQKSSHAAGLFQLFIKCDVLCISK